MYSAESLARLECLSIELALTLANLEYITNNSSTLPSVRCAGEVGLAFLTDPQRGEAEVVAANR
jgi:hypothetical protein